MYVARRWRSKPNEREKAKQFSFFSLLERLEQEAPHSEMCAFCSASWVNPTVDIRSEL